MNHNGGLILKFGVDELLTELLKNREDHKVIYEEAVAGFKEAVGKFAAKIIAILEEGNIPDPHTGLQVPQHHLNKYDTAIKMLQMTTETELQLTQEQFNCYVMDQWHFQQQFLTGASHYNSTRALRKMSEF